MLTDRALTAQHGPELAEISELEEAITAAESAVETGRDEVRLEVGVHEERKFNEMARPIEAKHDAPWLRRRIENGVEVTGSSIWKRESRERRRPRRLRAASSPTR